MFTTPKAPPRVGADLGLLLYGRASGETILGVRPYRGKQAEHFQYVIVYRSLSAKGPMEMAY